MFWMLQEFFNWSLIIFYLCLIFNCILETWHIYLLSSQYEMLYNFVTAGYTLIKLLYWLVHDVIMSNLYISRSDALNGFETSFYSHVEV